MTDKLTLKDITELRKKMEENKGSWYEHPIVLTYGAVMQVESNLLALEQENEKLKKAIFVVYMKSVDLELLKDCLDLETYNNNVSFLKELTKQEYELLKEVLESDK